MVVIRDNANRLFYAGPNCWVGNPLRALSFASAEQAVVYAQARQMAGLHVLDLSTMAASAIGMSHAIPVVPLPSSPTRLAA